MPAPPSPESVPATGGSRIAHQTMYKSAAIGIFMTKISQNMAQKLDTWRMVPGKALATNRPRVWTSFVPTFTHRRAQDVRSVWAPVSAGRAAGCPFPGPISRDGGAVSQPIELREEG